MVPRTIILYVFVATVVVLGVVALQWLYFPWVQEESLLVPYEAGSLEDRVLDDLNRHRGLNGVKWVCMDPVLQAAASWHANDMAVKGYQDHVDSLGRDPGERAVAFGHNGFVVQMIATAREGLEAFKQSPNHNEALLRPDVTTVGIGISGRSWVIMLGDSAC